MNRKRTKIVSLILVIGIALGWWLWSRDQAPRAFILELKPIDADTALITWRANYADEPSRGWISSVDALGRTKWWRELPDVPLTGDALHIGKDVVAVRYSHDDKDQALVAFSLDDGTQLWDRVLSPYAPIKLDSGETRPGLGIYFSGAEVDGHFVELVDAGEQDFLIALDPHTGRELWRTASNEYLFAPWTAGSQLIQHDVFVVHTHDVTDGSTAHRETIGRGCMVGDDYVTIERSDGHYAMVAFRPGNNAARRVLVEEFTPLGEAPGYLHLHSCGRYRDRLVFSLDLVTHRADTSKRSLVVVTDQLGSILHTIELPYDMHWSGAEPLDRRYPQHAPLSGELTRFAPYLQVAYGLDGEAPHRLIMFDLEDGKIAWMGPHDASIIHTSLFRVGSLWYWGQNRGHALISVFDGNSGQLRSAIFARHNNGVGRLGPMQVRENRVWMHSGDWTPVDAPPISVLDASLFPLSTRSSEIASVNGEVRAYLESR